MWPVRKNFYNKDILMIHQEELVALVSRTDNLLVKRQIRDLIERYEWEKEYLNGIPYELRSWPNCYIGFSISDERNSHIIELAIQDSMDDCISGADYLIYACGVAYLEGKEELANELSKIKKFFGFPCSGTIKDMLQVVTEDTLDYVLAYEQTRGNITNDQKIVFYNGEKYVVLDTTSVEDQLINRLKPKE